MTRVSAILGTLPKGSQWVLAISVAYLLSFSLAPGTPAQLPIALAFFLTCPGLLLLDRLDLPDLPTKATLTMAASLAINILVVIPILALDVYSPTVGLVTVGVVSIATAVLASSQLTRTSALLHHQQPAGPLAGVELVAVPRLSPRRSDDRTRPPRTAPATASFEPEPAAPGRDRAETEAVGTDTEIEANARWQIDAMEWQLTDGSRVDVVNVLDEASRVCVASVAYPFPVHGDEAWETVFEGASRWGVPHRVVSGRHRRPFDSSSWSVGLEAAGIVADDSLGRPLVSRFQQTLKRALSKEPAADLASLREQLTEFARLYNHERSHRGVGGRTPASMFTDLPRGGLPAVRVSTAVVDWAGRARIDGSRSIVVPARHAGQIIAALREDQTVLVFVKGRYLGHLELDPNRFEQAITLDATGATQ